MDRVWVLLCSNEKTLWALVVGALVVDLGLTIYGLELGFSEQNQLAVVFLTSFGATGIVALKLGALGLAVGLRQLLPLDYRGLVPLALAIPWWIGAISNAIHIAMVLM
jgi:hypothetical protein